MAQSKSVKQAWDDMTERNLRNIARHYGIPEAETKPRTVLVAELGKKKVIPHPPFTDPDPEPEPIKETPQPSAGLGMSSNLLGPDNQ